VGGEGGEGRAGAARCAVSLCGSACGSLCGSLKVACTARRSARRPARRSECCCTSLIFLHAAVHTRRRGCEGWRAGSCGLGLAGGMLGEAGSVGGARRTWLNSTDGSGKVLTSRKCGAARKEALSRLVSQLTQARGHGGQVGASGRRGRGGGVEQEDVETRRHS